MSIISSTLAERLTIANGIIADTKSGIREVQYHDLPDMNHDGSEVKSIDELSSVMGVDQMTAATLVIEQKDVCIPALVEDAEEKVLRHVRTAAGSKRFGQPIGSIIVRDGVKLPNLKELDQPYAGWSRIKGSNGKEYFVGKADDDGKYYATEGDDWDKIAVGPVDSAEKAMIELNDAVKGKRNTRGDKGEGTKVTDDPFYQDMTPSEKRRLSALDLTDAEKKKYNALRRQNITPAKAARQISDARGGGTKGRADALAGKKPTAAKITSVQKRVIDALPRSKRKRYWEDRESGMSHSEAMGHIVNREFDPSTLKPGDVVEFMTGDKPGSMSKHGEFLGMNNRGRARIKWDGRERTVPASWLKSKYKSGK